MISEKVLEIALRKTPVTDDEWKCLLEERQKLIRPRLRQVANAKLGDARYVAPGIDFKLSDFIDGLVACQGKGILQTRGIFGVTRRRTRAEDDRRLHVFGLTRDDVWAYYVLDIGCDDKGMLSSHVLKMPDDFGSLDITYRRVFNLLGMAVEMWMRRREKLFREAQGLHRRFAIERELFDHIWSEHEQD